MSLSAHTGLVHIPTVQAAMVLAENPTFGPLAAASARKSMPDIAMYASLKTWDPVAGKVVWESRKVSFSDHGGALQAHDSERRNGVDRGPPKREGVLAGHD